MICFAKFFSVIRHRVKRLLNYNRNIGLDKTKRLINHRSSKGPSRRLTTAITVTSLLLLSGTSIATAALPSLKTSNDGHFIIQEDGTPFFWLADDAWGLHSRLNLKDAERFLDTRKSQGFTVIHTWLASTWILQNLNGDEPFQGALNNANAIHLNKAFFEHIGEVIDLAEKKKLYLLLEIGQVLRKNVSKWWIGGFGSHGDHVAKAYEYGWRLAQILKKKGQTRSNLIWGLGQDTHPEWGQRVGDKNAANSARNYKELVQSMAEGLADATNGLPMNSRNSRADYSTTMMSFHVGATGPKGGPSGDPSSSSEWFHKDDWLDYNAHQSGRHDRYIAAVHQLMSADYNRSPTKPALETEVSYENQVIEGESGKQRYTAYHSRLHAYWAVFSGGAGHQYGNNNVWQFYDPSRFAPRGEATTHWATAIKSAGAKQMGYLRSLIESRPFLGRIPDQHLLSSKQQSSGHARLQATRADDGSYAFIYSTNGRDFDVNLDQLSAQIVNVWWYDPRTGKATYSGQLGASGVQNFDPPGAPSGSKASEGNDWVLVLDDTSRDFPAPGSKPPIIVDPTNQPPVASAGSDQTTIVPANASLQGEASDDGLPSGKLITKWSLVSGPGKVTFSDATAAKTTVSFSDQGRYVLRLSASDGKLSSSDEVTITVRDEPGNPFGTPANLKA
ncbi:MAG: DUF4038 domain-containing protein, partial [Gammaproteobacteria bacterium]|nr:DUF4038 domain-containing protein [Gammaproteobacteria bacterium]